MINYVIGDDVFELNVNDVVYVKNGVNGYFGVVVEIRENFRHVTRTIARCGDLIASSRCHDDDKFNAWVGAKMALERLEKKFIEKAEREKKEKLLNNWYDSLTEEKKEFVKKKLQEEK